MANSEYQPLTDMAFDIKTEVLTHEALLTVNNVAVGATPLSNFTLNDGDCICFMTCISDG
jgi:hypothetical protein